MFKSSVVLQAGDFKFFVLFLLYHILYSVWNQDFWYCTDVWLWLLECCSSTFLSLRQFLKQIPLVNVCRFIPLNNLTMYFLTSHFSYFGSVRWSDIYLDILIYAYILTYCMFFNRICFVFILLLYKL